MLFILRPTISPLCKQISFDRTQQFSPNVKFREAKFKLQAGIEESDAPVAIPDEVKDKDRLSALETSVHRVEQPTYVQKRPPKYAVVGMDAHQVIVEEGCVYETDRMHAPLGSIVQFPRVLMMKNGEGQYYFGQPYLKNIKVYGQVLEHYHGNFMRIIKFKPKKHYWRIKEHWSLQTRLMITRIEVDESVPTPVYPSLRTVFNDELPEIPGMKVARMKVQEEQHWYAPLDEIEAYFAQKQVENHEAKWEEMLKEQGEVPDHIAQIIEDKSSPMYHIDLEEYKQKRLELESYIPSGYRPRKPKRQDPYRWSGKPINMESVEAP